MPIFIYRAKNQEGKLMEGLVEAASPEVVETLLAEKNFSIISIEKKEGETLGSQQIRLFGGVKVKDLVIFFRQLSVMVEANLPIVKALRILMQQTQNRYLKAVIGNMADEVEGGAKLSQAMAEYPDIFGQFFTNIVASGETSGRLNEVMNYLADQKEKDYDLGSKVKGAMIYPIVILCGLVVVGFVMMTFVVPKLTGVLQESNTKLPLATKLLIGISTFMNSYWWAIIAVAVVVLGGAYYYFKKKPGGRNAFDSILLKVPVFGSIFQQIYIVRITQSLNTLLKGGVPVAKALETVRDVMDNKVYRGVVEQAMLDVGEGNPLGESLAGSRYVPSMVAQMISIGEETGKLDVVLEKLTTFYTREIDNLVKNLSTLIEPLIMIILGLAVGGFIAAIIMPMWQLSAAM